MKHAYLEEADQPAVTQVIRDLLKERGALITEFTHNRVKFEGLRKNDYSFTKGGYVGVYQRVGEREVQVRLRVEATIPARIFWRTVMVELIIGILVFIINPDATTYTVAAAALWAGLIITFLVYLGTWRTSFEMERDLLRDIVETLRHRQDAPKAIELEEDRLQREFEEKLEAEVARERLKSLREARATPTGADAPPKGAGLLSRLPLGKARAAAPARAAPQDPEEKRARIAELRAELERRKREGQN